jgi:hypothetical protein
MGSVAEQVVRTAPCPVLLMRQIRQAVVTAETASVPHGARTGNVVI